MITLLCIACTTPEAFKVFDAQTKLNQILPSVCFKSRSDFDFAPVDGQRWPVKFYFANTNTVGFMEPGDPTTWLNRRFHDSFSVCKTASTIAHELTHHAGFRHFDAAYQVNQAFEECCL